MLKSRAGCFIKTKGGGGSPRGPDLITAAFSGQDRPYVSEFFLFCALFPSILGSALATKGKAEGKAQEARHKAKADGGHFSHGLGGGERVVVLRFVVVYVVVVVAGVAPSV